MLPGNRLKKAWATSGNHSELGAVIYDEKVVTDSLEKWMTAKKQASESSRKWAKAEKNSVLKHMFTWLDEANDLCMKVYGNFIEKHHEYRKVYKELYQERVMFDEMKKQTEQLDSRVQKMFKSYENVQKKTNDPSRKSMAHEEFKKALKAKEEFHVALDHRKDEIQIQTLHQVRANILNLIETSTELHQKMLTALEEQKQLVNLYIPEELTVQSPNFTKSHIAASLIISRMSEKLQVPQRLSRNQIYAGASFQAFRFISDKEVVLGTFSPLPDETDAERTRKRSQTEGEHQKKEEKKVKNSSRLMKPLPLPRPSFSHEDLRCVGRESSTYEQLEERSRELDSDEDYGYTGPYLTLVSDDMEISPEDASTMYEKLSDWLSRASPNSSLKKVSPPPVPERVKKKPPKPQPPAKPKDIHKRLEFRIRSQSEGMTDNSPPDVSPS